MSQKIDSLMNVVGRCMAEAAADRMMIEALLTTHPNPLAVKEAWKRLQSAYLLDHVAVGQLDSLGRTVDAQQEEAFAHWAARLSVAVARARNDPTAV